MIVITGPVLEPPLPKSPRFFLNNLANLLPSFYSNSSTRVPAGVSPMNRRDVLKSAGAATAVLAASRFPLGWSARADSPAKKRHLLVFTRSQGFQHPVVTIDKKSGTSLVD